MQRSRNFLETEKTSLLEIVDKYKNVLENKKTNAASIQQKKKAWDDVTTQFNGVNINGQRDVKQLQNLYANMKRVLKKKIAEENMQRYVNENPNTMDADLALLQIKEVETKETKESKDKKEIMANGGGEYTPLISDADTQLLGIIGDQIKPLYNSVDSSCICYGDIQIDETNVVTGKLVINQDQSIPGTSYIQKRSAIPKRKFVEKCTMKIKNLQHKYYTSKTQCCAIEKRTRLLEYQLCTIEKKKKLAELKLLEKNKQLATLQIQIKMAELENILRKNN